MRCQCVLLYLVQKCPKLVSQFSSYQKRTHNLTVYQYIEIHKARVYNSSRSACVKILDDEKRRNYLRPGVFRNTATSEPASRQSESQRLRGTLLGQGELEGR